MADADKDKQNKPASEVLLLGLDVDTGKYYIRDNSAPKFIEALFKTGAKYFSRELWPEGYNMPSVWPTETDIDDRGRPVKVAGNRDYDEFRKRRIGQVKFFPGEVNFLPAFSWRHFKKAVDSNRFAQPNNEEVAITLEDGGWKEIDIAATVLADYKIVPSRPLPESEPTAEAGGRNLVQAQPVPMNMVAPSASEASLPESGTAKN